MSDIKKAKQANLSNPQVGMNDSYGSTEAVDAAIAYSRKSYDQLIKEKGQIKDLYASLITYLNGLSTSDLLARLQSYDSPEIIPQSHSRNSLLDALAKTMISRLSKKDLEQIVGQVQVSNAKMINDLKKDIAKGNKQYVSLRSLQTYSELYGDRDTGKGRNERQMKKLLQGTGLVGLDYIFGKNHGMSKLYKELMAILGNMQPTELAEIALKCGIEFPEGAARKSIASLISNKCCMYAAIILGKSKMTMAAGGDVRAEMDELIGMTSFATIVGKDAIDQGYILAKRREMEQAKVRARLMQQTLRRRGKAVGNKGLQTKRGLFKGLRTIIAGRKKVKLSDKITYIKWVTTTPIPGLVLSPFTPADPNSITEKEIDTWLALDNGEGNKRSNEQSIREYADAHGVVNALADNHYSIYWVIEQIGGPSQSSIKAAEKAMDDYKKSLKWWKPLNHFGKRREKIERNRLASQDVLGQNTLGKKVKTDRNGNEIRKDANGNEIRKGQKGYDTATAVTDTSFSANVAEDEKPTGGSTPAVQLKEAATLEDVDWVVPVYVVNGLGSATPTNPSVAATTASVTTPATTTSVSMTPVSRSFDALKSQMDAMSNQKAVTSAELMAANPKMTQDEADAESRRQNDLLSLRSKAVANKKANDEKVRPGGVSITGRRQGAQKLMKLNKEDSSKPIPADKDTIYSDYSRAEWKKAEYKKTLISPVFVTNKFTDRVDDMLDSSKSTQSATQSIYDYMITYLPVLFGGLQEAGLSANVSAVTSTGVLTATGIASALDTANTLASAHLNTHAKGAVGKLDGHSTQFIAGDSLTSKPNPELVTIDNKTGDYYVKPIVSATPSINHFATGGTGGSTDGSSSTLTSTERQAPMSVSISSGIVSYDDTISGALNDGTKTALKVWAVNGNLDRKYKVGDTEVSLMDMAYGIYGQVTSIASTASAAAQYLAALASTAGSILSNTTTIASNSGSSSGSSDPFSSTGMENILAGT